jgi:hypothetical protein
MPNILGGFMVALRKYSCTLAVALACSVGGCGTFVPDFEPTAGPNAHAFLMNKIINHVKCELREAVFYVIDYDKQNALEQMDRKRRLQWLESWSAWVTIKFSVNEKGALNPGVTFIDPLPKDQSFSLGLGGLFSSEASRIETVDYLFVFKDDFINKRYQFRNRPGHCIEPGGILIESDLKLKDWLWSKLFPYFLPENIHDTPPKTLTDEIAFVRISNGDITPTWKLVRFSATGNPFASIGRTRTDNLIITLGPYDLPTKTPSKAAQDSHLAAKIGSAVAEALKSQRRLP